MPGFIWDPGADERYLFHYTRAEDAEDLRDGVGLVGPGSAYGEGFYATDMAPDSHTCAEIHDELWEVGPRFWNAVVVIEVDVDGRPFQCEVQHHWRIADTDRVALGGRIIGVAVFDEAIEEWIYDEDLVMP
jgi:hypothetical protein